MYGLPLIGDLASNFVYISIVSLSLHRGYTIPLTKIDLCTASFSMTFGWALN